MIDLEKMKENSFENEEQFQSAAIRLISYEFPKLRGKTFHCMNEYYIPKNQGESIQDYKDRCARYGNANKSKGKLAGVPDILIVFNGILYKIELKQPNGTLGEAQIELHKNWNIDCIFLEVQVCYTLYHVYRYCQWIVTNSLKINFPEDFKPFKI